VAGNTTLTGSQPLTVNTTGNNQIRLQSGGTAFGQAFGATGIDWGFTDDTGSLTRMVIDSSGNVGIGTNAPYDFGSNFKGLTLNGVKGGAVAFTRGTNSATKQWAIRTSDDEALRFEYGSSFGSEALRLDSSGNVGIGNAVASSMIGTSSMTIGTGASGESAVHTVYSNSDTYGALYFADATSGAARYQGGIDYLHSSDALRLFSSAVERMRIDSSGNLFVNSTASKSGISRAFIEYSSAAQYGLELHATSASVPATQIAFYQNNSFVGSISSTASSTAYNTSSDYRLKTDAQPMTGASARVQALNPVNFEWIADGTRVDGFLAHEAQAVVPESVTGTKDAMRDEEYQVSAATGDIYTAGAEAGFNEVSAAIEASPAYYDVDGNIIKAEVIAQAAVHEAYDAVDEVIHSAAAEQPETLADGQQWRETTAAVMGTRSVPDMQGIDQSKMVPLLVAALQEALARITALENA
jgi:hypothetical protein